MSIDKEFLERSAEHLLEGCDRIERCLRQLSPEEIWRDHNENLVSVGNLILHLEGNVTQWVLRGLGGEEFTRRRDEEFRGKPELSSEELIQRIRMMVGRVVKALMKLSEDELMRDYTVQGYTVSGVGIVTHVVEHFSYHVGQITFAVKFMKDVDMAYYGGRDLNTQ